MSEERIFIKHFSKDPCTNCEKEGDVLCKFSCHKSIMFDKSISHKALKERIVKIIWNQDKTVYKTAYDKAELVINAMLQPKNIFEENKGE